MTSPPAKPPSIIPGSARAWAVAVRPASLLVAASPVLAGVTLAGLRLPAIDGRLVLLAMLALAGAVLMQLVTNLQNDVGFTVRGGERDGQRTGLPRATASGWLTVNQARAGVLLLTGLALALGLLLIAWRGWPVLAIGSASLLAALAYMGGPRPLAYTPLGELVVLLFFGLVAVTGTDWLLTGQVGPATPVAACAIGSLAAAALAVNNHRDIDHDRAIGRRTFAARHGVAASRRLFAALLAVPFLLVPLIAWTLGDPLLLLPLAWLASAWRLWRDFVVRAPGAAFNPIVFRAFQLEWRFALLLSIGAALARLAR